MTRRFTAIGAAMAAALVLSAAFAAVAWASYDTSGVGGAPEVSGSQTTQNVWTTNSGTIKCEEASASGGFIGGTIEPTPGVTTHSEITVHTTYNRCRAFGLAATITTTGCNTIYTTATTTSETSTAHAAVHLECEAGHKIVVNAGAGGCIVEFGEQTPGGVVDLTNVEPVGQPKHVIFTKTLEAITYHQEGSKCTGGSGTFTNGTSTGSTTIGAFLNGQQINFWVT